MSHLVSFNVIDNNFSVMGLSQYSRVLNSNVRA